ncbi:uncharacterized protein zgc:163143 [Colossoma macropomum]|uniref:uncharacterized protein zgc:163143 n=1 Tax=Colossoma macropomum TaxID=42526 RepID=UPI001864080E|nr:uncharacterized protein zgc:163143 [Colossoma macropomum]
MVFYCCAYNCKNNTKDKSLAFHSFPLKNPELLKKWLRNIRWKDWSPEPHSRICSSHFERRCYSLISGPRRRLHTWAVPTIFSFPDHLQNRKRKIDPRSRRALRTIDESVLDLPSKRPSHSSTVISPEPQPSTSITVRQSQPSEESSPQNPPEPGTLQEPIQTPQTPNSSQSLVEPDKRPSPSWTILGDESLERSMTIPSFFHSGYCLPRSFCWDGDDELNIMPHVVPGIAGQTKPRIIEVTERWEWLGLDIRGPFPLTSHKHTHVMTLTDYYSKWVEAFPLTQNKIRDAAVCLAEVIFQLGFPLGVLSRLPKHLLLEINRELKKQLNVNTSSLVIHHRQTGYLDLVTESLLNELVGKLVEEYPRSWDIHLPVASLRLCCTQHPTTGKKPFTVMYSKSLPAFIAPRELPCSAPDIRLSSFIIPHIEASKRSSNEETPSALPDQR